MLKKSLLAAAVALACTGCATNLDYRETSEDKLAGWKEDARAAFPKKFNHVLIIVLENRDKEDARMSLVSGLEQLPAGVNIARFENFHGLFHPSYSNYLAMVSGKKLKSRFDGQENFAPQNPNHLNDAAVTIADQFEESVAGADKKATVWRNYAEGYPSLDKPDSDRWCFTGSVFDRDHYARKHVPFLSFTGIRGERCTQHIMPIHPKVFGDFKTDRERWEKEGVESARQFLTDWKNAQPKYAFYSPNMIHNGHNLESSGGSTNIQQVSSWLGGFFQKIKEDENGQFWNDDTLVVVTYDESEAKIFNKDDPNEIYTVFIGKKVKNQRVGEVYNHFNVLRTIEDNFGLAPVGDMDAIAKPITGIWN